MSWIKKNKDRLLAAGIIIFFAILVSLSSLLFTGENKQSTNSVEEEEVTQVEIAEPASSSENESKGQPAQSTSFFLRPSAEELLKKLEGLSYSDFKKETKQLPGLKVMWPAYFFSAEKIDAKKVQILLDTAKDGFGVELITEIDIERYPEILALEKGTKIWIASEITGFDPTGTGLISLRTEHVRFDDFDPHSRTSEARKPEESEETK